MTEIGTPPANRWPKRGLAIAGGFHREHREPTLGPGSSRGRLELVGVSKSFGPNVVLRDATLAFDAGTVHALVGENGAGKSTLGKIVAGVHMPERGHLAMDGESVTFRSPLDALRHGITAVAQEISLVPARSVIENVFLGTEETRFGIVGRRALRARYADLCADVGFQLDGDAPIRSLRLADRYKVELLRAVARYARLVVLDEPTAALNDDDSRRLLGVVAKLKARGAAIIYISHNLAEVLAVSDQVTVLRDGELVETLQSTRVAPEDLVTKMLGRPLTMTFPRRRTPRPGTRPVYTMRGLCTDMLRDVDLEVHPGEIVGLAGLVGSGRTEVARAIFGVDPRSAGEAELDGRRIDINSPRDAVKAGVAMIPEERKAQGLVLCRNVAENITLAHLDDVSSRGIVRPKRIAAVAGELMGALDVQPRRLRMRTDQLSGGNQQKVLFARWLQRTPRLLIVDEPTRGIDIGAKAGIYQLVSRLAGEGVPVILISSETEEILGLCNRVLVMQAGRVAASLSGTEITEAAIIQAAFGLASAA